VAGFDIVAAPHEVRRRIGYVTQMLSADGSLTGYENLLLSARLYSVPRLDRRPRIEQALSFMGLRDSANRLVKTYSGGMVRRLELAQSMLHKPTVLFLDEQTIGLDPVARHEVWKHLNDMNREFGMTILLTTHDMEEADHLCADVAGRLKDTAEARRVARRKLIRDPTEVFSRAIQPVLWLAVFGQVLSHVRGIDTGKAGYLAFMTPGILAQSVLFGRWYAARS